MCSQGECIWLHLDIIKSVVKKAASVFPITEYAYTTIPTYPSGTKILTLYLNCLGQIGFIIASKDVNCNVKIPKREVSDLKLKYYSKEIHEASFVLPEFARRVVEEAKNSKN